MGVGAVCGDMGIWGYRRIVSCRIVSYRVVSYCVMSYRIVLFIGKLLEKLVSGGSF